MVDPTPDDRFNALGYSTIRDDISLLETEINLPVGGANAFNKAFQPGASVYATLTDVLGSIEVIKITDIEGDKLTVERGQDVSIAQAWLAGSIITQRFVATNALQVDQKTVFRTIAFNPNGSMTADYPGEKVRETGLDACANRWWKNTFGTNWRLIAGIRCPGEIDDGEGYPQPFTERDIFLMAGQPFGGGTMLDVEGYEPDVDIWTGMSDLPVPARKNMAGFTLNLDFGYVCGGEDSGATYQTLLDEYNLDVWAGKTSMPAPARRNMAGFQISDKGYIAGGGLTGGISASAQTDEYDPDTWTTKTAMPAATGEAFGTAIGSKGYSFGGVHLGSFNDYTYEYTPDAWVSKAVVPTDVFGGGATELLGKGYLFGGGTSPPFTVRTLINREYDPTGDSWAVKTSLPAPARNQNAASEYDNKGYSFSGAQTIGGPDEIDDVDEYDPVGDSWANVASHPAKRRSTVAIHADGGL